jgi:hypothetical protein
LEVAYNNLKYFITQIPDPSKQEMPPSHNIVFTFLGFTEDITDSVSCIISELTSALEIVAVDTYD